MPRHPSVLPGRLLATLLAAYGLVACEGAPSETANGGGDPALADYPFPPLQSGGETIATVGPVNLTTEEVEARLAEQNPAMRAQLHDLGQLRQWVRSMARTEAIAQAAWKEGLQDTPEVRAALREVLVKAYTERAMRDGSIALLPNEAEILALFETRKDELNVPDRVRMSQIVIYVDSPKERKAANQALEQIRDEVIEGQKKNDHSVFARAAREMSEDESTKLGAGDLRFRSREQLAELYGQGVADATFDEARIGDLYVANAPNAVVLFKKSGFRRGVTKTFEDVKAQLRTELIQQRRRQALETWSDELLEKAEVELDDKALGHVRFPESTPVTEPTR